MLTRDEIVELVPKVPIVPRDEQVPNKVDE